jgi:dienelactone hydrolase
MRAPDPSPRDAYLAFIRAQVPSARGPIRPPATLAGWDKRLAGVADGLRRSFGRMPEEPCDLAPEILGTLPRDGYAIERLTFQSRPGVRVTANLYRPDPVEGKKPAVLSVHGHWAWARIDPHVQARCIGLAKLGYVCLCVDAFGSGERAIDPAPGTYHGALVGASLWPAGVPLLGLQVYDNRRAVDYLLSRPEVDPHKLAITGASGGGNQTLYAGATDSRFAAVVPVCGIGTYESYLGTGCCVCEALVGGLTYATTGDVLAMVAPRALMVINATQDAIQFSVGEARKSVDYARERFRLLGVPEKVRHVAIESGHDYNRPMREAMYGWLDHWLRGRGDGSPVAEPELTTEDPQTLRCYPDGPSRPKTIVTIPEYALREGKARLAALPPAPDHPQRWEADAGLMRSALRGRILGGFPDRIGPDRDAMKVVRSEGDEGRTAWDVTLTTEPGITLRGRLIHPPGEARQGKVLLLRPEGMAPADDPNLKGLLDSGWVVLTVDLRATGSGKAEGEDVRGLSDHNEAEWGLWIGRPLLGQWAWDATMWLRRIDAIGEPAPRPTGGKVLVGVGPFGLVALMAEALGAQATGVVVLNSPISLVGEGPWAKLPMGLIAPNLLDVGDVAHIAALTAPRRLAVLGGVEPNGTVASEARLADAFAFTRAIYKVAGADDHLVLSDRLTLPAVLKSWVD